MGLKLALWSVAERREIRRFPRVVDTRPLGRVVWSPDGKTIAAEGRIWDVATGRVLVTFRTRDGQDASMRWLAPRRLFPRWQEGDHGGRRRASTSGMSPPGGRWGRPSGRRSDKFRGDGVLSPDGRLLATGGYVARDPEEPSDPAIRIWDLASGREVATMQGHEKSTLCLAFSPDGRRLASGSGDRWSAGDHDRPDLGRRHRPRAAPVRRTPGDGQRRRLHARRPLGRLGQRGRHGPGLGHFRPAQSMSCEPRRAECGPALGHERSSGWRGPVEVECRGIRRHDRTKRSVNGQVVR